MVMVVVVVVVVAERKTDETKEGFSYTHLNKLHPTVAQNLTT
jgi:hypothetical protein